MTLMPFSIPEHIQLLLSGAKKQTTRQPRKTPLKVGDILHCWYKPRQRKTCGNCIVQNCKTYYATEFGGASQKVSTCSEHRNFFGIAKVTEIMRFRPQISPFAIPPVRCSYADLAKMDGFVSNNDLLGNQNEKFMEAWARADGFANLEEAHKWFTKSTKNGLWMMQPWDVIIFTPAWVK